MNPNLAANILGSVLAKASSYSQGGKAGSDGKVQKDQLSTLNDLFDALTNDGIQVKNMGAVAE